MVGARKRPKSPLAGGEKNGIYSRVHKHLLVTDQLHFLPRTLWLFVMKLVPQTYFRAKYQPAAQINSQRGGFLLPLVNPVPIILCMCANDRKTAPKRGGRGGITP